MKPQQIGGIIMRLRSKAVLAGLCMAFVAPLGTSAPLGMPPHVYAEHAAQTAAADGFAVDFKKGVPALFQVSDGWTNGDPFNVFWHNDSVTFEDGMMQLIIDYDAEQSQVPYAGGELQSKAKYGYGRYETSMRAIKNDGCVSSFFTYTGPSFGDPWDEIDFEVLGKDTTKVQLNYFRNGVGGHEKMIDLGFDASEDFHTYAFEWHADKIIWFVDGAEIYRIEGGDLPVTKAKIMMNAWCGKGVDAWLKPFDDTNLPVMAEYQWIRYTPFAQ